MAKRRTGSRRSGLSTEEKIRIINDWMVETGADEIDMKKVADWAMDNGRWRTPPYDPRRACARELSEAAREEYYVDPQNRTVRKKHCYVVVDADGQRHWNWVDIETAKPDPMHKSLQARRKQALGDVVQLDIDRQSYNDNNLFGAELEMSYNFDEDLAERSLPTSYPEHPGDDDLDDEEEGKDDDSEP
jgi:hypothetical protein